MDSHVVLVGLMGSGKSTLGRVLAARLDWPLRDSDAAIEGETGHTVRDLAVSEGIEAMHGREAANLLGALAEPGRSVICAAASTIDREDCRKALAGAFVVWLHADPAVLARRFRGSDHRPRFGSDPADVLDRQERARAHAFRAAADLELDGTGDPGANAERILAALGDR